MPTYLCHGFRWERQKIRVFVLLHNLEDAAPDWVMGRRSAEEIREQMEEMFDFQIGAESPHSEPTTTTTTTTSRS
ncbi:hypothetical protein CP532_5919 [Ophiocordyceps camponoti-leonardi (nom. inval.)]|nr:hypothetical protein CP532_5919 [Ophiocordyceps camponoti-leonardi (nom. inval.)]